jgi:hypothetical protein
MTESDDSRTVTVCAACLCACCWQGKLYCGEYKTATTRELTVTTLRKLALENPDYWSEECNAGEK